MRTLLLSCLLSMGPVAAGADRPTQCQRTHERIERLRDLSSLGAPPTTLSSAKVLHAALQARVRQIEAIVGHTSAPAVLGQHATMLAPPPGELITPESFGGDPTGNTDATAALQSCVRWRHLHVLQLDLAVTMFYHASPLRDAGACTWGVGVVDTKQPVMG